MSLITDIIYIMLLDYCVVSWFPLLGDRDNEPATIYLFPRVYYIYIPKYLSIILHINNL